MADLRDHKLPKKYRICCLDCCEVEYEKVDANPGAGIVEHTERKCKDDDDDCKTLRKKIGSLDYADCQCLVFKRPKDEKDKKKKARWELVKDLKVDKDKELASPDPKEDKEFYYSCFCVAEGEGGEGE